MNVVQRVTGMQTPEFQRFVAAKRLLDGNLNDASNSICRWVTLNGNIRNQRNKKPSTDQNIEWQLIAPKLVSKQSKQFANKESMGI